MSLNLWICCNKFGFIHNGEILTKVSNRVMVIYGYYGCSWFMIIWVSLFPLNMLVQKSELYFVAMMDPQSLDVGSMDFTSKSIL